MIIRGRPSLFQLFFILRGSVILRVFPQILITVALSALVVWLHETRPGLLPAFNSAPFALFGIALSIFLGFRNNACYDRWWEARRHWGEVLAASRDLDRQTLVLAGEEGDAARRRVLILAMAFSQSLVLHLRPGGDEQKALRWLAATDRESYAASRNKPHAVLRLMSATLAEARRDGLLDDIPHQTLERTLATLEMVLAACERLRSTPIPFGYTLLLHRTAYLFCFLLPFGFANLLDWATPLATGLVAYTFFGLDELGDQLEEPFGTRDNDLPIGALADQIELGLREALGESDLPPPPKPVNYVLM
jgi:ion channel-forming bestrophin family protein